MEAYLDLITEYAANYGILFIVPFLFLENMPFIGFIAPGVTILFLSGFFSGVLPGGVIVIFLIAYATVICADSLWYWLGYWNQGKWQWAHRIATHSPNVEKLLTTQPYKILIFYQFIPYFRMFLPFALGMYRYPKEKWFWLVATSSFLYMLVYLSVGYAAAHFVQDLLDTGSILQILTVVISVGSILYGIKLAVEYWQLKNDSV